MLSETEPTTDSIAQEQQGVKKEIRSEQQLVEQLREADTRRKMPYTRMGRDLLEMGIVPTDEMLEAMGMSREEARKYVILKQFEERG